MTIWFDMVFISALEGVDGAMSESITSFVADAQTTRGKNRRVPARQPASFSLNRKENEAKETLPLRGACLLPGFGAVNGGDA
jgi:hypothetical protein